MRPDFRADGVEEACKTKLWHLGKANFETACTIAGTERHLIHKTTSKRTLSLSSLALFYLLVCEGGWGGAGMQRVDYTTLVRLQLANTASAADRALSVYVGVPVGGRLLATKNICGSEQLQRTTV